jgi:predicted aspartyl protease
VETKPTPSKFSVWFHFDAHAPNILLKSYWGNNKNPYTFIFDNHSPTWVNGRVIEETKSIRQAKNISYRTSTADGNMIKGSVYVCDTVSLAGVAFNDVLLYKIEDTGSAPRGVIGENIISKGVWMIDFENQKVFFASSVDSFPDFKWGMLMLPAQFENNIFTIESQFANGMKKRFAIDLGFNGFAILPLKDFDEVSSRRSSSEVRFSTPGGNQVVKNYTTYEKVMIGTDSVGLLYSSNEKVAESVVGLGFFRQFSFVVLDYINHTVFVSRFKRPG